MRLLLAPDVSPEISVTGYEVVRLNKRDGSLDGGFTSLGCCCCCCCCSLMASVNDETDGGGGGGGGGDPLVVDIFIDRTLSNS